MTRETKKTIIAQIHQKHYTFVGKSFRPNKSYVKWCSDNDATLALSRLNITELINRRDVPVCTKCDCIITDTDESDLCKECWTYDETCTDCGRYECDKVKCWTCDDKCATHKVFRDALNENEFTCDECYENEYGDSDSDDDTDWDKTPREVAPPIPFLPDWVKEEGKRLIQRQRVGNISVNFSPELLKAMELKRKK